MPLVAPDVCRYTMNGLWAGRQVANILDMVVDPSGTVLDGRDAAIEHVAGVLLDEFATWVVGALTVDYQFTSVSWVDLNSATGSTGERTSTDARTLPIVGGAGGAAATSNVAMLVKKVTTSARGQRAGRWYLPNPGEVQINENELEATFRGEVQGNLNTFLENITETGVAASWPRFPTVVHTRNIGTPSNPNIEYVDNTQITTMQLQSRLATQRRRLRP